MNYLRIMRQVLCSLFLVPLIVAAWIVTAAGWGIKEADDSLLRWVRGCPVDWGMDP